MSLYLGNQLISLLSGVKKDPVELQNKTVDPSESEQIVTFDEPYDGLKKVTITPIQTEEKTVNANGTYISSVGKYLKKIIVSVPDRILKMQTKTVTPTKSTQDVVMDDTYDGLTKVTVNPIPDSYIIPSGSETKTANGTYDVTRLAQLIVDIPPVNSLPSGISAFTYGTITVSSAFTTASKTFNHNLGVTPDLMILWAPNTLTTSNSMLAAIRGNSFFGWRSGYTSHVAYKGTSNNITWNNNNNANYGIGFMTATDFNLTSYSTTYYWRAGTYYYIAIKFS